MVRPLLLLVVVAGLLACPAPTPGPRPDGACTVEENPACDSTEGGAGADGAWLSARLLICRGGHYAVYSDCRGPAGCSVAGDQVSCDFSGNSAGDRCPPTSEGKVRCDPDAGVNILRCVDGGLSIIFECAAPTRCVITDGGVLTCG